MPPDNPEPHSSAGGLPPPGTVDVAHEPSGIAVVTMRGEHDISTATVLIAALEQAAEHSHVLVDLSECSFIDSTAIAALITSARGVQASGERFAVAIPPSQSNVTRITEMIRLSELVPVHPSREAALESLQP